MFKFIKRQNSSQVRYSVSPMQPDRAKSLHDSARGPYFTRQSAWGNQAMQRLTRAGMIQGKLKVKEPGDMYEQEADPAAEQALHMLKPNLKAESTNVRTTSLINRMVADGVTRVGEATHIAQEVLSSPGQRLHADTRAFFESRLGHDLGNVRIHSDTCAAESTRALSAQAYTVGNHIVFGAEQYDPIMITGKSLLAHELCHVIQQGHTSQIGHLSQASIRSSGLASVPLIQRRLIATGTSSDIDDMLKLLEPAVGLDLEHNQLTNEIEIKVTFENPDISLSANQIITDIIEDTVQMAEIQVGKAQKLSTEVPLKAEEVGTMIGQFPFPLDFTGSKVQIIDIDDLLKLEEGSKGHGVGALVHEIVENYHAHGQVPQVGVSLFDVSHPVAVEAQSKVVEELVGPGRRTAFRNVPIPSPPGSKSAHRIITDYETYYLIIDNKKDPAGSTDIISARKVARIRVAQFTIDNFVFGSAAVPQTGRLAVQLIVNYIQNNDTATVRIEGFTDNIEAPALVLGTQRAEMTRDDIIKAGAKDKERFYAVGRGATEFVSPGNQAQNRRVVIMIDRPDI